MPTLTFDISLFRKMVDAVVVGAETAPEDDYPDSLLDPMLGKLRGALVLAHAPAVAESSVSVTLTDEELMAAKDCFEAVADDHPDMTDAEHDAVLAEFAKAAPAARGPGMR